MRHTRVVVSDKPLPAAPHTPKDVPVAEKKPAKEAQAERAHPGHSAFAQADLPRAAHTRSNFSSSEETRVLREREAWLRGLDRKYGVVR